MAPKLLQETAREGLKQPEFAELPGAKPPGFLRRLFPKWGLRNRLQNGSRELSAFKMLVRPEGKSFEFELSDPHALFDRCMGLSVGKLRTVDIEDIVLKSVDGDPHKYPVGSLEKAPVLEAALSFIGDALRDYSGLTPTDPDAWLGGVSMATWEEAVNRHTADAMKQIIGPAVNIDLGEKATIESNFDNPQGALSRFLNEETVDGQPLFQGDLWFKISGDAALSKNVKTNTLTIIGNNAVAEVLGKNNPKTSSYPPTSPMTSCFFKEAMDRITTQK